MDLENGKTRFKIVKQIFLIFIQNFCENSLQHHVNFFRLRSANKKINKESIMATKKETKPAAKKAPAAAKKPAAKAAPKKK